MLAVFAFQAYFVWGANLMYEQRQLFDFILNRVDDTGTEHALRPPQAFGRWFAGMYFDKPQNLSIADVTCPPLSCTRS